MARFVGWLASRSATVVPQKSPAPMLHHQNAHAYHLFTHYTTIPARSVLGSISGNITHRKELTPYNRGVIIGKASTNTRPTQIAEELSIPRSTVQETLYKSPLHHNSKSASHSGALKKLSKHDERRILHTVQKEPQITYARLIRELTLTVSHDTIYRLLKDHNIINWRVKKRPLLTEAFTEIHYK